ncbi:MAG: hypothetical protein M3P34_01390 [Actinomycetota bacterium]|nr:hypothetical protein [Actinomycetota bacterium]
MPEACDRWLEPVLFHPFAVELAARAAALGPARVLELAAGTGALTKELLTALLGATVCGGRRPPHLSGCHRGHGDGGVAVDAVTIDRRRGPARGPTGCLGRARLPEWPLVDQRAGGAPGPAVLGQLAVRIDRLPHVGEAVVVGGWQTGADGRKLFAGAAVWTIDGEALAVASATWIVLKPEQAAAFGART